MSDRPKVEKLVGTEPPSAFFQNSKASLWFGIATALGVVGGIILVSVFVLTNHPHRAVFVLGVEFCLLGALRGLWPGRPWFASRNKWADAAVYLVVGTLILSLSPWTATIGV